MGKKGIFLIVAFITFYIWEKLSGYYNQENILKHDFRNFSLGGINFFVTTVLNIFLLSYIFEIIGKNRFKIIPSEMNMILRVIIIFILLDLWTYIWHRLNHRVNFFWRFHRVHHIDKNMNATTAFRFHFGEITLSFFLRAPILLILGVGLRELIFFEIIMNIVVYFHHSNIKINDKLDSILRKVIVTPNMHKMHHSVIYNENNSNFSAVFSIWDRLLKTYTKFKYPDEIKYGLNQYKEDDNLINSLKNPIKN